MTKESVIVYGVISADGLKSGSLSERTKKTDFLFSSISFFNIGNMSFTLVTAVVKLSF